MGRKDRKQIVTKYSDICVAKHCELTKAERCETATQIRRQLSLPSQDEPRKLLVQAGVPEVERDLRSSIIVRQAVRTEDNDPSATMGLLKYSGYDPHYWLEIERLLALSKEGTVEKTSGERDREEVSHVFPGSRGMRRMEETDD